jgi:hypothetical protein
MVVSVRFLSAALFALAISSATAGEDRCLVNAVIGGKPARLEHCAVAFYESENSVTLYFTETALSAEEAQMFQLNANPEVKDSAGRQRTMAHLAFCPGGGEPTPSPGAVRSVEMSFNHASSILLGRQWVFELPKDKELKIEKLSGDLRPGGRLAGRVTGGKKSDGLDYSWQIDFDLRLPEKPAAAGPSCGH